ncbi:MULTISPECIES: L,D-transpeptidase family protein [unclassified Streptomyces]|uniref:L,D-transpeptidase family protein n=1 Tax=unclassified Streptomyces TaxID=2593676 RepID=UPI0036EE6FA2
MILPHGGPSTPTPHRCTTVRKTTARQGSMVRLSTSGTFVHGNYWGNPSSFGRVGTSHGCIGLRDVRGGGSDTPAKWFYDHSLVGDVIIVKNSPDSEKSIQPDNGLNGWNMNWETWTADSTV